MPKTTTKNSVIRESWLKRTNYGNISRFETTGSPSLVGRGIAIDSENNNENMRSAGSGNFVPFLGSSNPRVLSDMGLAIPRPTRLGDPRLVTRGSLSNIILTSLIPLFLFKTSWLSWLPAATPFVLAATQSPLAADDYM